MKKKILSAVVAAAALFGAYTAQQASSTVALSDLQIENLEALAGGEPSGYACPGGVLSWKAWSATQGDGIYGYDCMCNLQHYDAAVTTCSSSSSHPSKTDSFGGRK